MICLRHHSVSGANNTDSMVVLAVDKRAKERERALKKLSGSLVQYGIARDDLGMCACVFHAGVGICSNWR